MSAEDIDCWNSMEYTPGDALAILRAHIAGAAVPIMSKANTEIVIAEIEKLRAELAAERERYAFLAETNENLRRNMETNIQFWRSSERDALRELLREASEELHVSFKTTELRARIDAALGGGDE